MHASAQRNDKAASSSVDPVRQRARSAARNPPGKPMPTIATPANLVALQRKIQDGSAASGAKSAPRTAGLPSTLKAGIEGLSGMPMDDVRVHYNSDKPIQMLAHAYTQGVDIHVAPGQEKHLPHEAWHAVQQKQKRVPVTMQMKGVGLNEDNSLEHEADEMGKKAAQRGASIASSQNGTDGAAYDSTASTGAPVVQRASIAGFFKGAGKVIGNVALGPLWDAGKAINRRRKKGNLLFGSAEYRRYLRQSPNEPKKNHYQSDADLTEAYGGAPTLARSINILSAIASDTAKYAGWVTGVSGIIMLATGGTAAPALAPVATMTGSIAAVALTAKLALAACNQAYLANRIDTNTDPAGASEKLRNEERHARSDYGQAMLAGGTFAGMGIGAEAASGASIPQAWLEVTGQTEANSSLPEVAAGVGGEVALTGTDAAVEESHKTFVKPFEARQKPKKSWGLQWLNPVYLLVRGLKGIANGLNAIWNSFRAEGSHKGTKQGAKFKVGDAVGGGEGYGHMGVRGMRNFTRGANEQLDSRDQAGAGTEGYGHRAMRWLRNSYRARGEQRDANNQPIANSPEGNLRSAGKHVLGTIAGGLGAIGGLVAGGLGGLVGGAAAGMIKGWNKSGLGGAILGLVGGGVGGLGAGLVAGTALGAMAGWDAGHMRPADLRGKIDTGIDTIAAVAEKASDAWGALVAALTPAPASQAAAASQP